MELVQAYMLPITVEWEIGGRYEFYEDGVLYYGTLQNIIDANTYFFLMFVMRIRKEIYNFTEE